MTHIGECVSLFQVDDSHALSFEANGTRFPGFLIVLVTLTLYASRHTMPLAQSRSLVCKCFRFPKGLTAKAQGMTRSPLPAHKWGRVQVHTVCKRVAGARYN